MNTTVCVRVVVFVCVWVHIWKSAYSQYASQVFVLPVIGILPHESVQKDYWHRITEVN